MKKLICLFLCILLLAGCAETYDGPVESKTVLSSVQTTYYYEGAESQLGHTEYAYDIYGNQTVELEYRIRSHGEELEPYLKTVRTHDENGNCIRQRQYDVSGLIPRKIVDVRYEYDEKGRMTAHLDQMEEQYSWTAVYDDEARTLTCTYPHAVSVSWFDEQGRTVRQETTFQNGETSGIIYEFDASGNRISARYNETGGVTLHTYTYDDQGRVLTMSETTDSGTRELFRYVYDGEDVFQYNFDGTMIHTAYRENALRTTVFHHDKTGTITSVVHYHYTEIPVPVKEATP